MMRQFKIFWKFWQGLSISQKRMLAFRLVASLLSLILGCGIIFNLRAEFIGEGGASMAAYSFGALIILATNVLIFAGKIRSPEALALKLCIATVIFASAWVNIEEKLVLPLIASSCNHQDCEITYERHIPFSDAILIYRDDHTWDVLD